MLFENMIVWLDIFDYASRQVLEPSARKSLVNVSRWFDTCVNQPQFLKVLGKLSLCEKMVPVTPKHNPASTDAAANNSTSDGGAANGEDVCMWDCWPECLREISDTWDTCTNTANGNILIL